MKILFQTYGFYDAPRIDLGSDLVSQIAHTGKPQIVNYLNALSQQEMLPYYDLKDTVQTFLGVPIFYPVLAGITVAGSGSGGRLP